MALNKPKATDPVVQPTVTEEVYTPTQTEQPVVVHPTVTEEVYRPTAVSVSVDVPTTTTPVQPVQPQPVQPTAPPVQPQPQPQYQQYQQYQQPIQEQTMANPTHNTTAPQFNSASLFTSFGSVLSTESEGDLRQIAEFALKLIDEYDEYNQVKGRVRATVVKRETTGNFSSVVLSLANLVNGQKLVAYHTLMLEKSRAPIDPVIQDTGYNGIKVPVIVATADAYNDNYRNAVVNALKMEYQDPTMQVVNSGLQIITRESEIKEPKDLFAYVSEAANALTGVFNLADKGKAKFNLESITKDPSIRVYSRVHIEATQKRPNGLPVRSDIVTELTATRTTGQQTIGVPETQQALLTRASAYVDLIYAPPVAQSAYGYNPQYMGPQPYYIPRLTITQLETEKNGSALEFLLLGIANLTVLARNRAYGVAWKQAYSNNNRVNLRDFGAVGLQVPGLTPDGQPDILDVSGSDAELRDLMNRVLYPDMVYTLEIEQAGLNTWLLNMFAQASGSDQAAMNARAAIYEAANNLTNGRFGVMFSAHAASKEANPITRTTNDQNYVGYFSSEGQLHDLRELDLLAMLNLQGKKDTSMVEEFLQTLVPGTDILSRLDRRLNILKSILSDVTVKGYSTKYDFNKGFIECLVASVEACNLVVHTNSPGLRDQQVVTHNPQDWASVMTNSHLGNGLVYGGVVNQNTTHLWTPGATTGFGGVGFF